MVTMVVASLATAVLLIAAGYQLAILRFRMTAGEVKANRIAADVEWRRIAVEWTIIDNFIQHPNNVALKALFDRKRETVIQRTAETTGLSYAPVAQGEVELKEELATSYA